MVIQEITVNCNFYTQGKNQYDGGPCGQQYKDYLAHIQIMPFFEGEWMGEDKYFYPFVVGEEGQIVLNISPKNATQLPY